MTLGVGGAGTAIEGRGWLAYNSLVMARRLGVGLGAALVIRGGGSTAARGPIRATL